MIHNKKAEAHAHEPRPSANNSGEHPCPPRPSLPLRDGGCHPFPGVVQRRLPPYLKRQSWKPRGTIWVVVGSGAWAFARDRVDEHHLGVFTLLPPGEDPATFDWRLLAGHDPILLVQAGAIDGDQVRQLAHAILMDGTERILTEDGGRYVREVTRAAA